MHAHSHASQLHHSAQHRVHCIWYADEKREGERGSSNEMNLLKLLLKFKYIIGTHNRPTQRREQASTPTRRQSTSESEEEVGERERENHEKKTK